MPITKLTTRRAPSGANVDARRTKMGQQLVQLHEKEKRVQQTQDLKELAAELKANPDLLAVAQTAVRAKREVNKTSSDDWAADVQHRTVTRLPPKIVAKEFLTLLGMKVNEADFKAASKVDPRLPLKILTRACLIKMSQPVGPANRAEWCKLYSTRAEEMGWDEVCVSYSIAGSVDWNKTGVFSLIPSATDPNIIEKIRLNALTFPEAPPFFCTSFRPPSLALHHGWGLALFHTVQSNFCPDGPSTVNNGIYGSFWLI